MPLNEQSSPEPQAGNASPAEETHAPLRRNVTIDDIGDAALYALSHLGRGMTGEVYHVDAGWHAVGAPREQA